MRHQLLAPQLGSGAPVYTAAVLENLCAEILGLAGNAVTGFVVGWYFPRCFGVCVVVFVVDWYFPRCFGVCAVVFVVARGFPRCFGVCVVVFVVG